MKVATVRAPATVSNVVCGFDCLGFALSEPFDEVTVRLLSEPAIRLCELTDHGIPDDPSLNTAGVALSALGERLEQPVGFEVSISKGIKPGSGIGSSAASACGAVAAANHLLGGRFSIRELIEFAIEGERVSSGARHADNVAPCLLGGFTLVRSIDPLDVVSLDFAPLVAVVIHPQTEIKTSEARALLPTTVGLSDAVATWSNLGALVSALARGDHDLIARSLFDPIVEPVRKHLIPGFDEMKSAALSAGAIGGGISGSGPSVFMLCPDQPSGSAVASAMSNVLDRLGIEYKAYVSEISRTGAVLR
jgi:homoserine kinase